MAICNNVDHYCSVDGVTASDFNLRVVHTEFENETTTVTGSGWRSDDARRTGKRGDIAPLEAFRAPFAGSIRSPGRAIVCCEILVRFFASGFTPKGNSNGMPRWFAS